MFSICAPLTIHTSLSDAETDVGRFMNRLEQQQNATQAELRAGVRLFISINDSGSIERIFRKPLQSKEVTEDTNAQTLAKARHAGEL